jgi:5-methylthioadenosine/S-adenosylhomocysteine deaminase
MNIDTLISARWVIPVEPEGVVYHRSAIAIQAGTILDIVPLEEAEVRYHAGAIHRLDQHAVIPGLVNAHTHAAMTLFRGLADDLPLMDWLNHHIWPAEQRWVTAAFVRDGVQHAIAEMLRGGTTCFNDMYFFPDQTAEMANQAGIRATVGLIVIDFPSAWAKDREEYFTKGAEIHQSFRQHPLIRTALAPHAPYSVSAAALERIRDLAEAFDIPIHMHVHETVQEIQQFLADTGVRPWQHLQRLGLLSPRLQAVHMTQLTEEEIIQTGEYGIHVIHCPDSNLKLASGFCPVPRLAQAGVNIALGTDGAASNNSLDMFQAMRTAALLAKAVAQDACAIPAANALRMATLNGARALGLSERIGSLIPGKAADLIAVDLGGIDSQPLYDPISQLVYATSRNKVSHAWIAGKPVVQNGALVTLDEAAILARTEAWRQRIGSSD